jgi:hypothetical protein
MSQALYAHKEKRKTKKKRKKKLQTWELYVETKMGILIHVKIKHHCDCDSIIHSSAQSPHPHFVSCTQSEAVCLSRKKAAHCTFYFRALVNFLGFIFFYRRHFYTIIRNG